jgi:aspartate/tyrosine/aromatic aminotransferase
MYERLPEPARDEILQLASSFREDERSAKIDLGIGVYRDASGATPIMRAIKSAEHSLWLAEESKAYIGMTGDERFNSALLQLVLGDWIPHERVRAIQTPGGGGGIRLIAEFVRTASPLATVWIGEPTWINHRPIMEFVGLRTRAYDHLDRSTQSIGFDRMMSQLSAATSGDVVLLQGCCHNPTGANLTHEQWQEIINLVNKNGFVPFIDVAYQGFGDGVEADALAARLVASQVPEMLLVVSCSKNFGVYRDRAGCAAVIANTRAQADLAKAHLTALTRFNYSFPPNHGAGAVRTVLDTPELKAQWLSELETMRQRIMGNRVALAGALRTKLDSSRFDFLTKHRGMFSLLGITPNQVRELREQYAVFMPTESRINLAGLQPAGIERLTHALHAMLAGNVPAPRRPAPS